VLSAEEAMLTVTGDPGSVFVTAATELATVAELEVKEALLATVAEPVVAPFVDPPTAGATALEKTAEEP